MSRTRYRALLHQLQHTPLLLVQSARISLRSSRISAPLSPLRGAGSPVAIAIGTTTHLLLAGPVKLPLLDGGMPLLESVCL